MRARAVLGVLAALVVAALCVRLGLWQLSRLEEKRALNRSLHRARSSAPIMAGEEAPSLEALRGRRARFTGRYDSTRHVLLAGRARAGAPGAVVVTPLILDGGSAVLVKRGWLPAADGASVRPEDHPEPGRVAVEGIVEALEHGRGGLAIQSRERGGVTLLTARWLDHDSLAARLPYRLAPFVVHQMPGPGVPGRPERAEPRPHDEAVHLGYAIQWFSFAAILLGGVAALWRTRGRRARSSADGS